MLVKHTAQNILNCLWNDHISVLRIYVLMCILYSRNIKQELYSSDL
jgi:hypothetical protein